MCAFLLDVLEIYPDSLYVSPKIKFPFPPFTLAAGMISVILTFFLFFPLPVLLHPFKYRGEAQNKVSMTGRVSKPWDHFPDLAESLRFSVRQMATRSLYPTLPHATSICLFLHAFPGCLLPSEDALAPVTGLGLKTSSW